MALRRYTANAINRNTNKAVTVGGQVDAPDNYPDRAVKNMARLDLARADYSAGPDHIHLEEKNN